VQYILKNDSPLNLSGLFMIELDLAVAETRHHKHLMTVYAHDNRTESGIEGGHFDEVKFTLDANENPSISVFPVLCNRSEGAQNRTEPEGVRVFLYWKVDLGPNFEMEKMAFLKLDT